MAVPTVAPTLVATVENGQVRIAVTANETDSTLAWLRRRDPDGVVRRVRSMQGVPLQNRQAEGYDYEVPLNVPVTYLAHVSSGDGDSPVTEQPVAEVPYTGTRLCAAGSPYWKVTAPIQSMSGMKRDLAHGAHYVLGRPAPITIASVRQLATFTVTIATSTVEHGDAVRQLLDGSPHLLLQGHPNEGGNLWFLCSSYTEDRAVPTVAAYPDRLWTLEAIQVDPPAAPLADAGRGTFGQVADTFASYAVLPDEFTSYAELALWNGPPLPVAVEMAYVSSVE